MQSRIRPILEALRATIDNTRPLLRYENAYQLMISVILSAQTTDEQVNAVTPLLFSRFPNPEMLSKAGISELEEIVHSTGFYRMKAKHIRAAAEYIDTHHDGRVPDTIEALVEIPGVGRKSANVILGAWFRQPAIIVDTHFKRVVNRIGLTASEDPGKIETEIRRIVRPEDSYEFSMLLNRHGRATCTARKPKCRECVIVEWCDHGRGKRNIAGAGTLGAARE